MKFQSKNFGNSLESYPRYHWYFLVSIISSKVLKVPFPKSEFYYEFNAKKVFFKFTFLRVVQKVRVRVFENRMTPKKKILFEFIFDS